MLSSIVARQPRARRDVVRQHARLGRHEQDVVEREAFLGELPVQGDEPLQLVLAEFDAQGMSRVPPSPDGRRPQHAPNRRGLPWPRCARCSPLAVVASRPQPSIRGRRGAARRRRRSTRARHGTIAAFAQDGPLIAWFAPSTRSAATPCTCISLANGCQAPLPTQGAARNVTCRWDVGCRRSSLALAGADVLWTLRESSRRSRSTTSLGAGVGATERESAASRRSRTRSAAPASGSAGSPATERHARRTASPSVDYVDEAGCLAGTARATLKIAGGGVYRVVGRQPPKLIPDTQRGAVEVAASRRDVAYVPAAGVGDRTARRVAGADLPIEIVDAGTGASISRVTPAGHAARDRARAARARDARAHAARAAARVVRPRRPAHRAARSPVAGRRRARS